MSPLTQATMATPYRETDPAPQSLGPAHLRSRYSRILLLLFFLTLPLVNPWVRGDGVGYYAYIRSLLVEHRLDFANDWRAANESFTLVRVQPDGSINPLQYTRTGHLDNHFTVGPSMLWAPFLAPVHGVMLTLQRFGIHVQANGYSRPYLVTMALATALYGFLGLLICFRLACFYTDERWAFLATLGIWFASSLPVYMYFNPSWSHAHSVFAVAAFLWYWQRTRQGRTLTQWVILGLISGLVLDIYYANIAVLLVPFAESLAGYWRGWRTPGRDGQTLRQLLEGNLLYGLATLIAFFAHLDHAADHLWAAVRTGVSWPVGLEARTPPSPVLLRSRSPYVDAHPDSGDGWLVSCSESTTRNWPRYLGDRVFGLLYSDRYRLRTGTGYHPSATGSSFLSRPCLSWGWRYSSASSPSGWEESAGRWRSRARSPLCSSSGTWLSSSSGARTWFPPGDRYPGNRWFAINSWRYRRRAATELAAYFENRSALMRHIEQDDLRQLKEQK